MTAAQDLADALTEVVDHHPDCPDTKDWVRLRDQFARGDGGELEPATEATR